MKYTKIIMFRNAVETLEFFSRQLAESFEKAGARIMWVDIEKGAEKGSGAKKIKKFFSLGKTALVTFNFIGLSHELQFERGENYSIFQELSIDMYNILVDHPLYYYKPLLTAPPDMRVFCIDRQHLKFLRRYYPHIRHTYFMPLAGNPPAGTADVGAEEAGGSVAGVGLNAVDITPIKNRDIDICFPANYVTPDNINERMAGADPEYREFFQSVMDDLISNTYKTLDETFEDAIFAQFPEATILETLEAMRGMLFIDLYVRSYFREKAVAALLDAGIPVTLVGKDWEHIKTKHPELIRGTGCEVDSATCTEYMGRSKLTLNLLPWFKDGAHDRIFSALRCGSVPVTDYSPFLLDNLTPGREALCFSIAHIDELPEIVNDVLKDTDRLEEIARCGRKKVEMHHTWENRAQTIMEMME